MKCEVCDREMTEPKDGHTLEHAPTLDRKCLGCWVAGIQLDLFIVRANPNQSFLGDWAKGWLREMLKDPRRYM